MTSRILTRLASIAVLCFLLAGIGCGSQGTLSGTVTYKNKKVVWGSVSVIASDNIQYAGEITPEGTYSIAKVPTGPVKLSVVSPNPSGTERGGPAAARGGTGDSPDPERSPVPKGAWFAIPEKYADPMKSGLSATVKGETQHNITLE